ncbi:TlyA family RNA methyltransferase [Brevibacterium sp. p3-SID960]|uniref:TlyA family RNA methyltransferase n=1 Tax=Brevibacterium sp. p3-SID960 TaxID=2916063 RepID=UPI0021A2F310|nr:TlyA family RNA methyltransferase [Brevibacterium sp. p3-SID960]MCT1690658.1 TlyA family RNA methyltransferase [Brevibacterium sp. p3-SID960]
MIQPLQRIDAALVTRGLAVSRNRAARQIAAGHVLINGQPAQKSSQKVSAVDVIEVSGEDPWVARSAHKLLGALRDFGLEDLPDGAMCLDAGASTGGFTQVLLAAGAAHVYAVDVGHDQLAAQLRTDARVSNMEGTNLRQLTRDQLPGRPDGSPGVDLIVADVSFISLTLLIEPLLALTRPGGTLLLMVKPQFERGRHAVNKHGVVTDPAERQAAIATVADAATDAGARVHGWVETQLPGPSGNREFFIHITQADSQACTVD